jgi:UDP-glucose 4-epimerase
VGLGLVVLADAHALALAHTRSGEHQIFNLGNGSGFSVREVIAAVEQVTGTKVPAVESARRPGDPPKLVAAAQKIRDELGWAPKRPELTDIIADAWAFHQAHPHGYSKS